MKAANRQESFLERCRSRKCINVDKATPDFEAWQHKVPAQGFHIDYKFPIVLNAEKCGLIYTADPRVDLVFQKES